MNKILPVYPTGEIQRRLIKYFAQFLIIAFAAYALPRNCIDKKCILSIALISASTFAIIDICFPAIINSGIDSHLLS
tara:strand:- start:53 stop:283 length:231 start_codon:yes stop_codon:yes gene_type:complete